MPLTDAELDTLITWVLRQVYSRTGGWLKAKRIAHFETWKHPPRSRTFDTAETRAQIEAYRGGSHDRVQVRRQLVAVYLWNEITDVLPEACSWASLVASDWQPIAAAEARRLVGAILAPDPDDHDDDPQDASHEQTAQGEALRAAVRRPDMTETVSKTHS